MSAPVLSPRTLWKRRHDLQFLEGSGPAVAGQDGHRVVQLVDEVGEPAARVQRDMTRPGNTMLKARQQEDAIKDMESKANDEMEKAQDEKSMYMKE